MIRTTLGAWLASLVTLLVSGAGLFAVSSTSTTTSSAQMAVAAAVLSAIAATAGLVVTDPWERSAGHRVLWGGMVPLLCGAGTAALVGSTGGLGLGLLAALPWLVGAGVVCPLGAGLPDLRILGGRSLLRRLRERTRALSDLDRR